MANNPIRIITLRQIIRLHCQGDGIRTINGMIGTSRNTIKRYLRIWEALGITYDEFRDASDVQVGRWFIERKQ